MYRRFVVGRIHSFLLHSCKNSTSNICQIQESGRGSRGICREVRPIHQLRNELYNVQLTTISTQKQKHDSQSPHAQSAKLAREVSPGVEVQVECERLIFTPVS